jgi:hypothetical protein
MPLRQRKEIQEVLWCSVILYQKIGRLRAERKIMMDFICKGRRYTIRV